MTAPVKRDAFKDCDIRGRFPEDLDAALFEKVGRAYGGRVAEADAEGLTNNLLVVGGDARASTPALREGFFKGLASTPLHIIDVGLAPTPVTYWAKAKKRAQASAIITASHNPPNYNGLKVMNGMYPPLSQDIIDLADIADTDDGAQWAEVASLEHWQSAVDDYLDELQERFSGLGIEKMTVAVDPGNGCFSGIATRAFERLGAKAIGVNDRLDGTFPDRHPDCAVPGHLTDLTAVVVDKGADLGIAFDGDGDRLAIIDSKGRFLGPERTAMILLKGALTLAPGQAVILDIKCSMHLERQIAKLGGVPKRCKSGHAYMKRMVLEENALAGVEVSGHIFLGEIEARDDPLYTALMLCGRLAGQDRSTAELADGLPAMVTTPDIRVGLAADEIDAVLAKLADGLDGAEVQTLDGVRLVWPNGWFLARRSITEPKITMRLEGETEADLARIAATMGAAFPVLNDVIAEAVQKRAAF